MMNSSENQKGCTAYVEYCQVLIVKSGPISRVMSGQRSIQEPKREGTRREQVMHSDISVCPEVSVKSCML